MEKTNYLKVEDVTPDQIEAWKKEHKRVSKMTINVDGEKVQYIIGRPTRQIVNVMSSYDKTGEIEKQQEVLVKNCIKAGDTSHLKDIDVFNTVMKKVSGLVEELQNEVEEL